MKILPNGGVCVHACVCVCVDVIVVIVCIYVFSIKTRRVCVGDWSLKTRNTHFAFKHDKWMCDLRLPENVLLTVNIVYMMCTNGRFSHNASFVYLLIQFGFTELFFYFVLFGRYPALWSIFTYHLWISCFNISHVEQRTILHSVKREQTHNEKLCLVLFDTILVPTVLASFPYMGLSR